MRVNESHISPMVSMTTCRIGDVIYKVCGNGHSEGFGVSARSILLTPKVANVGAKIRKVFDNMAIIRKKVMTGGEI